MDLRMPEMDGVTRSRTGGRRVAARVLVLTTYDTDSDVLSAIEAGATGYLLKDAPPAELFRAYGRGVGRGGAVALGATRVVGQVRGRRAASRLGHVSSRSWGWWRGARQQDAAARLFISEATVKTHLMHIYSKLGVNDRAAAVAEAFDRGLLIPRHLSA